MASNKININGLQFKPTRKKLYEVYICRPKLGTAVSNKYEFANYTTNPDTPIVISGTMGEQWTTSVAKIIKTYELPYGKPLTEEYLAGKNGILDWVQVRTRQDSEGYFAAHLPLSIKNFPVQTSWGDVLYANRDGVNHDKGDFIVCSTINGQPNLNDTWVINGIIFKNTYDMRSFPGFGSGEARVACKPVSLVANDKNRVELAKKFARTLEDKGNKVRIVDYNYNDGDAILMEIMTWRGVGLVLWDADTDNPSVSVWRNTTGDHDEKYRVRLKSNDKMLRYQKDYIDAVNSLVNKKGMAEYVIRGLRALGDTVGSVKFNETGDGAADVSFSTNNGRFGVIIHLNTVSEGTDVVRVMYQNNGKPSELLKWRMDNFSTIDGNIDKIHSLINSKTDVNSLINTTNKYRTIDSYDSGDADSFRTYSAEDDKPVEVKKLLKMYNLIKDKLQLCSFRGGDDILTETGDEPYHWRIDFQSKKHINADMFIDLYVNNGIMTVSTRHKTDESLELEADFDLTDNGYKEACKYIAEVMTDTDY